MSRTAGTSLITPEHELYGGYEVGCDEAGRGPLAGPVAAAAVIMPRGFSHPLIRDSKTLSEHQRTQARAIVESHAMAYRVAMVGPKVIDALNVLQAAILAMHMSLDGLAVRPGMILVDGNYFKAYDGIPHRCIVKGDARYVSIAAASILAKTYRDEYMIRQDAIYPRYGWKENKGYPTRAHREAIAKWGLTPLHRRSFGKKEG